MTAIAPSCHSLTRMSGPCDHAPRVGLQPSGAVRRRPGPIPTLLRGRPGLRVLARDRAAGLTVGSAAAPVAADRPDGLLPPAGRAGARAAALRPRRGAARPRAASGQV